MKGREFLSLFIWIEKMKKLLLILLSCAIIGGGIFASVYKSPQKKYFEQTFAAAQSGDVEAQRTLGELYLKGEGTSPDVSQAQHWFREAALQGDSQAAWKVAEIFLNQKDAAGLESALPFLQLAAREQQVDAQKELSRFYAEGLGGITSHYGESLYWLFLAAQNGDEQAQSDLQQARTKDEILYSQVRDFVNDLKLAKEGDGQARLRTARAYQLGGVIINNAEEAVKWFDLAWHENKVPEAGFDLAEMYDNGDKIAADPNKAMQLWTELTEAKYAPAQYVLGERSYKADPPNYDDAFAWFSNAAAGGYAPGQYMTGFMLMRGQGTHKSTDLAIKFFRDAAEQNYSSAQYVLGQIYWKGLGVKPNKKAGKQWLSRAAENGNPAARVFLEMQELPQ